LCKIAPNFACFWTQKLFKGGTPEFLDLQYKEHPDIYDVAKFHGDRPTQLGDPVAN